MSETGYGKSVRCEEGEFAGWYYWTHDPYESAAGGPFYMQRQENGSYVSAFRAKECHMNGAGFMHGGCLLTFADYALFVIATDHLRDQLAVTMNLSGDFLSSVQQGALVEARGEVTRGGGKTLFVRGLVTADSEPALSFTGIIRKVGPRTT